MTASHFDDRNHQNYSEVLSDNDFIRGSRQGVKEGKAEATRGRASHGQV